jgi:hypothetical protein
LDEARSAWVVPGIMDMGASTGGVLALAWSIQDFFIGTNGTNHGVLSKISLGVLATKACRLICNDNITARYQVNR